MRVTTFVGDVYVVIIGTCRGACTDFLFIRILTIFTITGIIPNVCYTA
jgi:hypothetical protein